MNGKFSRRITIYLPALFLLALSIFRFVYSHQPGFGRALLTLGTGEPALGAIAFLISGPLVLVAAAFLLTVALSKHAPSSRKTTVTVIATAFTILSLIAPFAPFTALAAWSMPTGILGSLAAIAGGALFASTLTPSESR